MELDYSRLVIEKAIAHQLPERQSDDNAVNFRFSRRESPLSPNVTNDLKRRISRTFTSRRLEVLFDPETESSAPRLIQDFFTGVSDFINLSCELTRRLHAVDPQRSTGFLALLAAKYLDQSCLLVTKLDSGSNLNFVWEELDNGNGYYRFDQIDGMPQYTKVFKVALFMEDNQMENGLFAGVVSDNQTQGIASFFLRRFLGCKPREAPEVTTERIFNFLSRWIETSVVDPSTKAKYLNALVSEFASNDSIFHAESFAQKHMSAADTDLLRTAMRAAELPVEGFEKDNNRIAASLNFIDWQFERIRLIAPADAQATGLLEVTEAEDGKVSVKFEDILNNARTRKRR